MNRLLLLTIMLLFTTMGYAQTGFKADQLAFERVKMAYADQWAGIQQQLTKEGYKVPLAVYLSVFKRKANGGLD